MSLVKGQGGMVIRCEAGPGIGTDHVVRVKRGDLYSAQTNVTISYAPPQVLRCSDVPTAGVRVRLACAT